MSECMLAQASTDRSDVTNKVLPDFCFVDSMSAALMSGGVSTFLSAFDLTIRVLRKEKTDPPAQESEQHGMGLDSTTFKPRKTFGFTSGMVSRGSARGSFPELSLVF